MNEGEDFSIVNYMPSLQDNIPTYDELESQYGDNTDQLTNDHEKLIEQILEEEEGLINGHRRHIDDLVDLVKKEMVLLNEVDKPGSDVEDYVNNLDRLLIDKISMIEGMRKQLVDFHKHLKTEECMSKLYQQQQNLNDFNIDDAENDDNLLSMHDM